MASGQDGAPPTQPKTKEQALEACSQQHRETIGSRIQPTPGFAAQWAGAATAACCRHSHIPPICLPLGPAVALVACFKTCSFGSAFTGCCSEEHKQFWDCYTRERVGAELAHLPCFGEKTAGMPR